MAKEGQKNRVCVCVCVFTSDYPKTQDGVPWCENISIATLLQVKIGIWHGFLGGEEHQKIPSQGMFQLGWIVEVQLKADEAWNVVVFGKGRLGGGILCSERAAIDIVIKRKETKEDHGIPVCSARGDWPEERRRRRDDNDDDEEEEEEEGPRKRNRERSCKR